MVHRDLYRQARIGSSKGSATINRMTSKATVNRRSHNGLLILCRAVKYKTAIDIETSQQVNFTLEIEMVKQKEEQTRKERTTQRRKRKRGWLNKTFELWHLCGFEFTACLRNPDSGQVTFFQTPDGGSLPRSVQELVSRRPDLPLANRR